MIFYLGNCQPAMQAVAASSSNVTGLEYQIERQTNEREPLARE
jgi:hypothetical protein